jgi:antitoxin HicB
MSIQYKAIIIQEEDGRFFVQFPTINEAFTEAKTLSDSLINAEEVLNLSLEGRLEDGIEIPLPNLETCSENEYLIAPEASIQSALLIHFNRGNLSPTELANILEVSIQEIENPKNNIKLKSLEKLAKIMGKNLILDFA